MDRFGFHSSAAVAGKPRRVALPSSIAVSGAEAYAAAARAGLGLIQALRYRLKDDFHRGALVPVLAAIPPARTPVSVLYPRTGQLSPRLRMFIDWLSGRFRTEPGVSRGTEALPGAAAPDPSGSR